MNTLATPPRRAAAQTLKRVAVTALVALFSYAVLLGACAARPEAAPAAAEIPAADGAWAEAWAALVRQADAGCPRAARLALDMARHGPAVYGMRFPAEAAQLRRWQQQLICREPPCVGLG